MADESITGFLLRCHAACSAQAHLEEFIHHNAAAMSCYHDARQAIESAIRSVHRAEIYQLCKKAVPNG